MPAYVEDPADTFDYSSDWYELIDSQSPASAHMSKDVQEATLLGYVPANKLRSAIRWLIGFAEADTAAPWKLRRENPQYHPNFPQLRAYDWSAVEMVPFANSDEENKPKIESPFATGLYTAYYSWALVTVRYRNFQYRFREDDQIADGEEWKRNCVVMTEAKVEALSVTGGMSQLKFAETAGGGPSIGTPFTAPLAEILTKTPLVVKWFDVPWEYLSEDTHIFNPTKIRSVLGKVNSDTFLGVFEPGTVLAEGYRYTVSTSPVVPEDANDPLRMVDVELIFTEFDPEKGTVTDLYRGHNLMPWGGTGATAGDGKFYMATRDGALTGDLETEKSLIKYTSFANIFKHVSAP